MITILDSYKTINETGGEGFYSEKRSKFLAFSHHVETEQQVKEILQQYRKKYYDARHVCYAYIIGVEGVGDGVAFRMNDDGEPSSTAGKPIHGQLVKAELTNTLIIVVRYYGGVNLGTSGLIVAYREAALDCINNSTIEERIVEEFITHHFSYLEMNDVMKVVKDMQPRIVEQVFDNTCTMTMAIRRSEAAQLKAKLGIKEE